MKTSSLDVEMQIMLCNPWRQLFVSEKPKSSESNGKKLIENIFATSFVIRENAKPEGYILFLNDC